MISSLVIKMIGSIFDIYLANKIGAETLGTYSLVMSIYAFLVTLATSGINLATTKIISEEIEKKNEENIPLVLKKAIIYSLIFGIFSAFLLIIFSNTISYKWLMEKVKPSTLSVLALSLPFLSITCAYNGYFLASRKVMPTSIIGVNSQLCRIFTIWILTSYVFKNNINSSILALILGITISEIISFILTYIFFTKANKKISRSISKTYGLTKRILKISLPIAVTSYIRSGLHTLKHILIPIRLKRSGMSYEKAISHYGIITGMAFPIIMFASVFVYSYSSLLIPEFSRLSVDFNKEKMNKDISKLFKVTLYFSIGISGILIAFGKPIGNILYNTPDVGWYIKMLAPLIVIMYLDNVIDNILKGLGKQVSVMLCNILDLVISISFIYFLLPMFSINGYIIVLYISEILNYTISVVTLLKTTDLKFKYFEWVIFPIIAITLAIFIANLIHLPISNNTINLTLSIFICSFTYIVLIYVKEKIHIV